MEQLAGVLLLTALNIAAAVVALSSARRAASFDVTRDFDALVTAVTRLQALGRSEKMQRVRQGGAAQAAEPAAGSARLSHEQLRAIWRARNTGTQQ